jgi:predicted AlkP superfamily pyrophosphatase or phosphodiesterase
VEILKSNGLYDKTNIVLVSDHGMTKVDAKNGINLWNMLEPYKYTTNGYDPNMSFFAEKKELDKIYRTLESNKKGYKLYWKKDIPARFEFNNNNLIGDILLTAEPGYYFIKKGNKMPSLGAHGYDNAVKDMHGIFVANGPAFKEGYTSETIKNIDIYPLLCKALNLKCNQDIDGDLTRVSDLLKYAVSRGEH